MVAPNNQPLVSAVDLRPSPYLMGEVTNLFQPTKLSTWRVNIPSPLVGNEAKAGYGAFTSDGVSVTCGVNGQLMNNFVGFFENQYFDEWNPGSIDGTTTVGDNFRTSVCQQGTIFVYNCVPITTARTNPTWVITSVTSGTTDPAIEVGALYQGASLPTGATGLDITVISSILTPQAVVGGGVLLNIIKA